jgi:multimeric flavodoxin WrbA
MKIIGISGSPRKGNTEWMLNALMEEAANNGSEVELLLLRKMDVRMCRGCLTCEEGGKGNKRGNPLSGSPQFQHRYTSINPNQTTLKLAPFLEATP